MITNTRIIFLFVVDIIIYLLAFFFSSKIRAFSTLLIFDSTLVHSFSNQIIYLFLFHLPIYLFLFYINAFYEKAFQIFIYKRIYKLMVIHIFLFFFIIAFMYLFEISFIPRSIIFTFLFINYSLNILFHYLIYLFFRKKKVNKVIIIQEKKENYLSEKIKSSKGIFLEIVSTLTIEDYKKKEIKEALLEDYKKIVSEQRVDFIIMNIENFVLKKSIVTYFSLEIKNERLFVIPSLYEIIFSFSRYSRIDDLPLIETRNFNFQHSNSKRIFDLFFSSVLILLLSPLMLVIYLLVISTSKGKGVFSQKRVGFKGRIFTLYKFRSMENTNDKRTFIGRFIRRLHVDELPQLFNIFLGSMSFIGPRPLVENEVNVFKKKIKLFQKRFLVKPGLTGLAQIHGKADSTGEIKLKYDLWYIYNRSLYMECYIFFETLKRVSLRRGV